MVDRFATPFTSISGAIVTEDTSGRMDSDSAGYVFVVTAGVLGAVALVLTIVYTYIYCVKIKPRRRHLASDRINYFERDACIQYGGQPEKDQMERAPIKAHPFFVIAAASRAKTNGADGSQHPSTSNKGY